MPVTVTILYPNPADATFDLDYYLKTHMPLAQKHFEPHGLKSWRVSRLDTTATGDKPPYSTQCILEFDTKDHVEVALKEAGSVIADVPNFTNQRPLFLVGEAVGSN